MTLEATTASEAMKVAFRSNMHMDSRVIEVAGFKSEAIFIALLLATLIGPLPSCFIMIMNKYVEIGCNPIPNNELT